MLSSTTPSTSSSKRRRQCCWRRRSSSSSPSSTSPFFDVGVKIGRVAHHEIAGKTSASTGHAGTASGGCSRASTAASLRIFAREGEFERQRIAIFFFLLERSFGGSESNERLSELSGIAGAQAARQDARQDVRRTIRMSDKRVNRMGDRRAHRISGTRGSGGRAHRQGFRTAPATRVDDVAANPPRDRNAVVRGQKADAPSGRTAAQAGHVARSDGRREDAGRVTPNTSTLLFEPTPKWHELHLSVTGTGATTCLDAATLKDKSLQLLETENQRFQHTSFISSADRQFRETILKGGTLNDKLSALTLSIQESPLHNLRAFSSLMSMMNSKNRTHAVQSVAAAKDLLVSTILPDRKLKHFLDQPALSDAASEQQLALWAFEDYLKNYYFQYLKIIERLCNDPIVFVRNHMISVLQELLKEKPEQEQNLLRLLIYKLGDHERKIAAKASYYVLQVEQAHPAMKQVIINELDQLLFRPNNNQHVQYYIMITLNQTVLSTCETAVADKLANLYFSFFAKIMSAQSRDKDMDKFVKRIPLNAKAKSKKTTRKGPDSYVANEEMNSKLISAILTGVNRAFPYANYENAQYDKYIDLLFMITHNANFNTSIQALQFIMQVVKIKEELTDRFYRTLYESLFDYRLVNSSKQAAYLNLLFKAIKTDRVIPRVLAFVKRLLQVCFLHQPPFVCGAMFLVSEIGKVRPEITSIYHTTPRSIELNSDDKEGKKYDGRVRDPRFANANASCFWEILLFHVHFHPTISLYAKHLLGNQKFPSQPDFSFHTLSHFLDKFVYRNVRQKPIVRGSAVIQTFRKESNGLNLLANRSLAQFLEPINTQEFAQRDEKNVPADEKFFHRFFKEKFKKETATQTRKKAKSLRREITSEDEDEVWNALVASKPDIEDDVSEDDLSCDFEAELEKALASDDNSLDDNKSFNGLDESNERDELDDEQSTGTNKFKRTLDGLSDDEENQQYSDTADIDLEDNFEGLFESASDILDSDAEVTIEPPKRKSKSSTSLPESDLKPTKKRKLKSLPVLADASQYKHLID